MSCLRCNSDTVTNFPKPGNKKVCGQCLHDLHAMHKEAEDVRTGKYSDL